MFLESKIVECKAPLWVILDEDLGLIFFELMKQSTRSKVVTARGLAGLYLICWNKVEIF